MTWTSTRWAAAALSAALGMLLLCSCGDDECVCPADEGVARDTPQHLVASFCDVLEARDIADYFWCLDGDYRFFFVDKDWDTAGVAQDAPYWEKWRDMASTAHMFGDSGVLSIKCDLTLMGDVTVTDTLATCTYEPDIQVTIDRGGYEPTTFWVDSSLLHFVLSRDRTDPDIWVIREIREEIPDLNLTAALNTPLAVEPTTFGSIKAMFK